MRSNYFARQQEQKREQVKGPPPSRPTDDEFRRVGINRRMLARPHRLGKQNALVAAELTYGFTDRDGGGFSVIRHDCFGEFAC